MSYELWTMSNPDFSSSIAHNSYFIAKKIGNTQSGPDFLWSDTRKTRSVGYVACALIPGHLWVRTKGPGFIDLTVCQVRGDDLGWFLSLLDPIFDHLHLVK